MEHLKNTTGKVVKKEKSTKKVLNRMEGITLVALVITVIVMLILAGVAISALMGNEGLFARTASAADTYKQASEKENTDIESLLNELDEALKGLEKGPTIADLAKNGTLKVGDYIDYDAGEWTEADLVKITTSGGSIHNTVNDEITGNQTKPTVQGQFGGFELGQSRNSNSTEYITSYKPRTSGWRIWDIDEDTGEVTIIHAGHSETYYHTSGKCADILRNRDCSMYENEYAVKESAHILKGNEIAKWYTKNCGKGTVYELESYNEDLDGDGSKGEWNLSGFVAAEEMPVIEVLENGSYYCFASAVSTSALFYVNPYERRVYFDDYDAEGVRMLVSLKSEIQLEQGEEVDGGWNTWKIVKN